MKVRTSEKHCDFRHCRIDVRTQLFMICLFLRNSLPAEIYIIGRNKSYVKFLFRFYDIVCILISISFSHPLSFPFLSFHSSVDAIDRSPLHPPSILPLFSLYSHSIFLSSSYPLMSTTVSSSLSLPFSIQDKNRFKVTYVPP